MPFDDAIIGNGSDFDPRAATESLIRQQTADLPPDAPIDVRALNTRLARKLGQPEPVAPPPVAQNIVPATPAAPPPVAPPKPAKASKSGIDVSGLIPVSDAEIAAASAPKPVLEPIAPGDKPKIDVSGLEEIDPATGLPKPPEAPKHNAFMRGLVSGALSETPENFAEALEASAHLAPDAMKEKLLSASRGVRSLSKLSPDEYKKRAGSMWDIKSFGDAMDYMGETLGSGLASSFPSMVGGAVGMGAGALAGSTAGPVGTIVGGRAGAFAGAAVPSLFQNGGEVYKALKDEKIDPETAAKYAAAAAVPMAALDSITPGGVISRLGGMKTVKQELARAIATRIRQEAVHGMKSEGITEGLQEMVKQATLSVAADKPFWTVQNAKDVAENVVGGALVGGVMSGVGGIKKDTVAAAPEGPAPLALPAPGKSSPEDIAAFVKKAQDAAPSPALPGTPQIEAPAAAPTPAPAPATPAAAAAPAPASDPDYSVLRQHGYADEDIANMSPRQRAAEVKTALDEGVDPVAAAAAFPRPAAPDTTGQVPDMSGSREAPIVATTADDVLKAQPVEPTEAQAAAENYKHAHIDLPQFSLTGKNNISVETGVGQTRKGVAPDGKAWETRLDNAAYGRIKGTKGADGQPLDIFVGPHPDSPHIFVVDQHHPNGGGWDEHKILAGFRTPIDALHAYANSYDDLAKDRVGHVTAMTPDDFKAWVKSDTTLPLKKEASTFTQRDVEASPSFTEASDAANDVPKVSATDKGAPVPDAVSGDTIPEGAKGFNTDTGQNVPESRATLKAQQNQLIAGERDVQMFPKGTREMPLPPSMERTATDRGTFHFNPKQITAAYVQELSRKGQENKLLGLGSVPKAEVMRLEAAGEKPVAVVERAPDGTEIRAAAGTDSTAKGQLAEMEAGKSPGNTVAVEDVKDTIAARAEKPKAVPKVKKVNTDPVSLLQFIASIGGIRPGPELEAIGLDRSHRVRIPGRKGFFSVVKPDGLAHDMVREAAQEAGYFPAEAANRPSVNTVDDLYQAADAELRGNRKLAMGEEADKTAAETAADDESSAYYREKAIEDARETIADDYPGVPNDMLAHAAHIAATEGLDTDSAMEKALIQFLDEDGSHFNVVPSELETVYGEGFRDEIQSVAAHEDGVNTASESSQERGPSQSKEDSGGGKRVADAGKASSEAVADAKNSDRPGSVEKGADGKDQTVIPGAEKIGDGKLAQMKADAALKPKVNQKSADVGMFGDSMNQSDLMDMAAAKPKVEPTPNKMPTASWVIKNKATGEVVMETFDKKKVDALNTEKYEAVPIGEHLASLNKPKPDLSSIFDDAVSDAFKKPEPVIAPTASTSAKAAIKNAAMGLDDVASGLTKLFGGNKLGSGPSFDEQTYKAALPFFKAGAAHFKDAASNIADMVRALVGHLVNKVGMDQATVQNMKPYVLRFVEDVQAGKETISDAPSSSSVLEPDRGNAKTSDTVGAADVPAAAGAVGPSTRSRGTTADQGAERGRDAGGGVPQNYAPVVGEDGHLEIPARQSEPEIRDAPTGEQDGGATDRVEGLPPDRVTDEKTIDDARKTADVGARRDAQRKAAGIKIKSGDIGNIAETLPMLFPEQQSDVMKAEQRFAKPDGHGMLFTNGTGTGKTYSGLGIVKRFAMQGKTNTLIVAPSQGILSDWMKSARDLGLDVTLLGNTKEHGAGIVATTYSNLGANRHLVDRKWDLVVGDEAHKFSSDQNGSPTSALRTLRAITLHPDGIGSRADMMMRDEFDKLETMPKNSAERKAAEIAAYAKRQALVDKIKADAEPRPKTLFMSATPFAYHFSLDYAEGYLYDIDRSADSGLYNSGDGRDQFYMQNLGYRMRTNKLTKPDADVKSEIMERQLHEKLKREGALEGRALTVDKDYDRKFILAHSAVGQKIDEALSFLTEADDGRFRPIYDAVSAKFDYLSRMRLLEAIKAHDAVGYIRDSIALNRKVVVFHDYNEGGGSSPFDITIAKDAKTNVYRNGKTESESLAELYSEFMRRNPYVANLNFSEYGSPLATLQREFPDALIYNGTVSNKVRNEAKRLFNDDNSGRNLIVVQSAAGEAGISLHDTTGKHQRVLVNLGMPVRPTTSIQQEGRIYRVGQASDALFRYMNTGTNWERWTFAGKIAERAGTAENLAMGDSARTIRQSFIDAFENPDTFRPEPGEGKGGKEIDRATSHEMSDFEKAKTHYFAQGKTSGRRDQRAGTDYYATPEPIGLKMVEFADIKPGERVLEPSGGHGAIARYFPEDSARTIVEPSSELASRASLSSPGARVVVDRFENLHITNKYDAIIMNPPFGVGGKTAMEHVAKAAQHLANGGRIVALVPNGPSATSRMMKLLEDDKTGVYVVGKIDLPSVTFERAGTSVNTSIFVLEKQIDPKVASQLQEKSRDYTDVEKINDLFDRIENADVGRRLTPLTKEAKPTAAVAQPAATVAPPSGVTFKSAQTKHSKTGKDLFVATPESRTDRPTYDKMAAVAKSYAGWYSAFRGAGAIPGFQFGSEDARQSFLNHMAGKPDAGMASALAGAAVQQPKLTPLATEHFPKIQKLLDQIIRGIAGPFATEFPIGPIPVKTANGYGNVKPQFAGGMYLPSRALIRIALRGSSQEMVKTAFHESYHAVEDRMMTDAERTLMQNETPRLRDYLKKIGTRNYTDAQIDSLAGYEVRAMVFEQFAYDKAMPSVEKTGFTAKVQAFFERLGRGVRRLSNGLKGMGFKTYEDIFETASEGGFAKREGRDTSQIDLDSMLSSLPPERGPSPNETIAEILSTSNLPKLAAISKAIGLGKINMTTFRTTMQDKFIGVKNMEQSVGAAAKTYQAESLYHGITGEKLEKLDKTTFDPLIKDMKARGVTLEDINRYLYAKHAPERNLAMDAINHADLDGGRDLRGRGSGMSDAEASKVIDGIKDSGKLEDYEAIEKRVREIIDETRNTMVETGLISEATADAWARAYKNYVPLRGFAEGTEDESIGGHGSGYDIRGKETKQALGRMSEADGPLAYVMLQAKMAIVRGEKNKVGNTFLRFARSNPDPTRFTVDTKPTRRVLDPRTGLVTEVDDNLWHNRPDMFVTKVGGRTVTIQMHGKEGLNVVRALKNMGAGNMNNVVKMLHRITSTLSRLHTQFNPNFAIPNFARDIGEAFVNLQAQEQAGFIKSFAKHVAPAMGGAFQALRGKDGGKYGAAFREFDEAGGRIRFFGIEDATKIEDTIEKKLSRLDGGAINSIKDAGEAVAHAFEVVNGAIENATRLAAYMAARDVGMTKADAAMLARNLTVDFNKRGEAGPLINSLYMFGNAAIQGQVRMATALQHPRVRKAAYGLIGLGVASAMYGIGAGGDDDAGDNYYSKLPDYVRDRNFVFMWPKGMGHDGKYFNVPLPYGFSMFKTLGDRFAGVVYGKEKPGAAAYAILGSIANAFNPLGEEASIAMSAIPSLMRPPLHIAFNKNWNGNPLYPDNDYNKSLPNSSKAFESTSGFSKGLAKGINDLTGGNAYKSGALDWHPGSIDHIIETFTGGVGKFGMDVFKTTGAAIKGEPFDTTKAPIIRRFNGSVNDKTSDANSYYRAREDARGNGAQPLRAARNDLSQGINSKEAADFLNNNQNSITGEKLFQNADSAMKPLRLRKRRIENDSALSQDERQRKIDEVVAEMRGVQNRARAQYRQLQMKAQ